jgi:hypothetical protein
MQNKHKATLNTSKNATCRVQGHDFRKTASDTYRLCCRSQCGAAERFVNGEWIDVEPVAQKAMQVPQVLPALMVFDWAKEVQA